MSIQKSNTIPSPRRAVATAIALTLAVGFSGASMAETPAAALAQASPVTSPVTNQADSTEHSRQTRMERDRTDRARFMQKNLDKMADRLQITAKEQPAWDQYKAARLGMWSQGFEQPSANMNAADLAAFHAKRAEQMAKKMSDLSQATSVLRAALTPSQQQVMDEMARQRHAKHFEPRGHKSRHDQGQGMADAPMDGGPRH